MIDTITLIGRAPSTRHHIADIGPDEKIYTIAACWDIVPRIDACVEIHPLWALSHPNYDSSGELWKWIKQPHDFPLYMQDRYANVPASVRFPKEDALGQVPIFRGDKRNEYASSSFDWLMGLVILEQPRRIKIIGYDMGSETEWRYQREGASSWINFAAGRGIEVWLPPECSLLRGMLYGYEGAQAIQYKRLDRLSKQADKWMADKRVHFETLNESIPRAETVETAEGNGLLYQDLSKARDDFFLMSGARQALDELREKSGIGDIITRQALETQSTVARVENMKLSSALNFWEGVVRDRKQRYDDNKAFPDNAGIFLRELEDAHKRQNKARDDFFTWKGALQMVNELIHECDFGPNKDWSPVSDVLSLEVDVRAES